MRKITLEVKNKIKAMEWGSNRTISTALCVHRKQSYRYCQISAPKRLDLCKRTLATVNWVPLHWDTQEGRKRAVLSCKEGGRVERGTG